MRAPVKPKLSNNALSMFGMIIVPNPDPAAARPIASAFLLLKYGPKAVNAESDTIPAPKPEEGNE